MSAADHAASARALLLGETTVATGLMLQKFSSKTYPPDVFRPDMPEDITTAIKAERGAIGRLWRCKFTGGNRWWYAWSPAEALAKALGAPL